MLHQNHFTATGWRTGFGALICAAVLAGCTDVPSDDDGMPMELVVDGVPMLIDLYSRDKTRESIDDVNPETGEVTIVETLPAPPKVLIFRKDGETTAADVGLANQAAAYYCKKTGHRTKPAPKFETTLEGQPVWSLGIHGGECGA